MTARGGGEGREVREVDPTRRGREGRAVETAGRRPEGGEVDDPPATRSVYVGPYRIDVTRRARVVAPVPMSRVAGIAARALAAGGAPRPASLGVVLTDDAELATLNEAHMGHEGPTDVLSFPLLDPSAFPAHERASPAPTALAAAAPSSRDFALPPGRRVHLGDVVLSVERAIEQAELGHGGQTGDVRWSPGDEIRLLVAHGALHVCGWDHAEPTEERAMRALEQELLGADT